ncbi:MAG: cytochrome c biogenesis protein CcdA [Gemmatimonadota bacterium]
MGGFLNLIDSYLAAGSALAYAAAFAGGALVSFTPCIYPLVPVTAGYVGGMSRGSRSRALSLSLSCALGIAVVYAALGAAAALSGTVFGAAAASPAANIVVGAVCVLMGLSMLDVVRLPLPSHPPGPGAVRGGHGGAFAFGAASGLVVGPCTAPVLGALLAYVASRRNVPFGASLLFVHALGMSLLPVLAGTFAGFLAALPRSGPWLDRVKKGFGAVLVAAGCYFLLSAAAAGFRPGARTASPPAAAPAASGGAGTMADFTLPDTAGRPITLSRFADGAPVLLVFWATWCPYCNAAVPAINALHSGGAGGDLRILAVDYKESPRTVAAFIGAKGVRYRVVLDGDGAVARRYGIVGIPTYILVGRAGTVVYRAHVLPREIRRYLD